MAGGFEALGLAPELVRAVTEDLGYLLPTNVQVALPSLQPTHVITRRIIAHGVRPRNKNVLQGGCCCYLYYQDCVHLNVAFRVMYILLDFICLVYRTFPNKRMASLHQ